MIDFIVTPYYERFPFGTLKVGGRVECPECGVVISYESNKPMWAWMERHSSDNELFGCKGRKSK